MEHLENFTDPSLRKRKTNHLSGKDLEYGSSKPVKRQLWTSFDGMVIYELHFLHDLLTVKYIFL